MKKLSVVLGAVIAAVAILAVPICSCQGEISFTTATLSNAKMASSIDENTLEPVEVTTTFAPDAPIMYCTAEMSHAPDETEIKVQWIYVEGEMEDLTDFLLYEDMIITGGDGYVAFSLESEALWPRGEYKVILYIDDKESQSVNFTVE